MSPKRKAELIKLRGSYRALSLAERAKERFAMAMYHQSLLEAVERELALEEEKSC